MATVRVSMKVCDLCGKHGDDVERYAMTLPRQDRKWLDLCAEHAAPLEAFRDVKSTIHRASRRMATLDEIEKLRQPRKRH